MPDIFISYSRKDSEQALALADNLRQTGADVWIDLHGIEAATAWSSEIVQAIDDAKAMVVLLSQYSVASDNVLREVSLAFEAKKTIIPVDLESVVLPTQFRYQLAGIQRANISDFDGILRPLIKLGIAQAGIVMPRVERSSPTAVGQTSPSDTSPSDTSPSDTSPSDTRKSLIVLPFEDLSPSDEDNSWFADGLAGEMIDALGHIKSLRILDRKTSIGLRGAKLRTVQIGKEFNTRYFIDGSVRKYKEQIKISVSLLDIETGEYLWQESHKGEFKDIFDIQETLAEKVVLGLMLHLTKEEKTLLQEHGTENTEAYKLFIKATEFFHHLTRAGFQFAIQLCSEAINLDPNYANAYVRKAHALTDVYRHYNRDPALLEKAMELVTKSLRIKPDQWSAYQVLSNIYQLQGKLDEAEEAAKEYVRHAPEDSRSHFTLGFFYGNTGQTEKEIASFEQAVRLNPGALPILFNLVLACNIVKDDEKQKSWADFAIPYYERHLKLFPDDEFARVSHATLFHFARRDADFREAVLMLGNLRDGVSIYNAACLQTMLHDYEGALKTFRKSVEAGFRNIPVLNSFLNDDNEGVAILKGTPEWEELREMVEKLSEP